MVFAELDGNSWALIIGAVFLGITKLWSMWLDYQREKATVRRDGKIAAKVKLVKISLETSNQGVVGQITALAERVEIVHKATNSLVTQLVDSTRSEAHAAGMEQQRLAEHQQGTQTPPRPSAPSP